MLAKNFLFVYSINTHKEEKNKYAYTSDKYF